MFANRFKNCFLVSVFLGVFLLFFQQSSVALASGFFDKPLTISLSRFEKFAVQKLESVFGKLKSEVELSAVDGWVSLNDSGVAADHAAVIARAEIDEKFMLQKNMKAALVLTARGSMDIVLLENSNVKWAPYSWEYIVLFKDKTKKSEIKKLTKDLTERFKNLFVLHFDELDMVTISARSLEDEGIDFTLTKQQADELAEFLKYSKSQDVIDKVELSSFSFRLPFEFSEIEFLDKKGKNVFDLNNFRNPSKEAARQGWAFTTFPAFRNPFGKGPLLNSDLEGKPSFVVTVWAHENFEDCKNRLKKLDADISHELAEILTLIITVPSDDALNKISSLKCVESVSKYSSRQ